MPVRPPTAPVVVLGIDVGSTGTKAGVVALEPDGTVHELAVRSGPTPQDVPALLLLVQALVADAVASAGSSPRAVGIASMAETGAALDRALAPITSLIAWHAGEPDDLVDLLAPPARFVATGVPATPKPAVLALARLRRAAPDVAARLHRWGGAADLVGLALTGRLATDHTLALRSGGMRLPPAGRPLDAGYDADLLRPFGVQPSTLPPVLPAGSSVGSTTAAAAQAFGLPPGIPVHLVGHDHVVGAWAAGVRGPGAVADSLGTAEAIVRFPAAPVDRAALAGSGSAVLRDVDGEREAVLTASTGSGAALRAWFGGAPPEGLLEEALRTGGLGDLVVLPYPAGRQAPAPDPTATLQLVDLDGRPVDRAAVPEVDGARALLAGLALQARWMDDAQREALGIAPEPAVVLVGGGPARLALKAAVAAAPSTVVTVQEPIAAGAALLAAVRAGLTPPSVRLPTRPLTGPPAPADLDRRLAGFRSAALGSRTEGLR